MLSHIKPLCILLTVSDMYVEAPEKNPIIGIKMTTDSNLVESVLTFLVFCMSYNNKFSLVCLNFQSKVPDRSFMFIHIKACIKLR